MQATVTGEPSVAEPTRALDPPPVPTGVLFPRQRPAVDYMQAYGGGELVLDEQGCLRLGGGGEVIV